MSEKINKHLSEQALAQIKYLNKTNYQDKSFVTNAYERGHASKANKPNIRRTSAYLNRLEKLIGEPEQQTERQARNERYLWEKAVESLIINPNDIADDYWKQQEQILRDNGQGRELSQREKDMLVQDIQQQQYNSAKAWADYLGQKDSPYPNWFKLYAWDGMSKLGVFDKDKALFKKRNVSTVAPYPGLNAEALAKTYEAINDYLGGQKPDDEQLAKLVDEGSFNKIYSHILMEQKTIVKTPERTEDVKGEWVEYDINSVAALAKAAEGTGWCISTETVAKNYLKWGRYGDDEYDDEYDGEYDNNQARFILFHLEDPTTGQRADNASASIRLDTNGMVAEISGLGSGQNQNHQAVEDALVPIVEAKVKTLPGGKEFLPKIVDKEHLIAMDQKLKAGERFSQEDIEFIFEFHRPINQLDTYGNGDPRIEEFKQEVLDNLDYYKNTIDINHLASNMRPSGVAEHLNTLLEHGADANHLASKMEYSGVAEHLNTLLEHGVNANHLASNMHPSDVAEHLNTLLERGATIDINQLASEMPPSDVAEHFNTLLEHGADANHLASNMRPSDVAEHFNTLLEHGADANHLASNMRPSGVAEHLNSLFERGVDANHLASNMHASGVAEHLNSLLERGADANHLASRMYPSDIPEHLNSLFERGADANHLASKIHPSDIPEHLNSLLERGADANRLVAKMRPRDVAYYIDFLNQHGANLNPDDYRNSGA